MLQRQWRGQNSEIFGLSAINALPQSAWHTVQLYVTLQRTLGLPADENGYNGGL
ncbi:MAG: hypothetical protein ACRCXB_15850 [Aeromonadaceae bacterium]